MWQVAALSAKSSDTDPSVLVTFESGRYIFNCGESTTRMAIQSGRGFRKVRSIMSTRVHSDCIGGIPGLLMTLADSGTTKVQLHGPVGLKHATASARFYLQRDTLSVSLAETATGSEATWLSKPILEDENLSIYGYLLSPASHNAHDVAMPAPSLKRKAADPLLSPLRKKPTSDSSLSGLSSSSFDPASLTGEDAEEWKDCLIRRMFPGDTPAMKQAAPSSTKNLSSKHGRSRKQIAFVDSPSKFDDILKDYKVTHRPLPEHIHVPTSLCYFGVANVTRGKFNAERALELGIPNGPLRGRLSKGETITLPNGNVVTPDMCIGSPDKPSAFAVIDCPDAAYIPSLLRRDVVAEFQAAHNAHFHVIIHMVGKEVLEDAQYQEWMCKFDPSVYHMIACNPYSPDVVTFKSAALALLKLSKLDSEIFAVPKFIPKPQLEISSLSRTPPRLQVMASNLSLGMRPPKPPEDDPVFRGDGLPFHQLAVTTEGGEVPALQLHPMTVQAHSLAIRSLSREGGRRSPSPVPEAGDDVVVTTLGTGSAMPSKFRNVSATLITIPNGGYILLDAGEGTFGQLARQFGTSPTDPTSVWNILRELRCIFISHIHGDHMIGIARLLSKRRELAPERTLYLVSNYFVKQCVYDYSSVEDLGLQTRSGHDRVVHIEARDLQPSRRYATHDTMGNRMPGEIADMMESLQAAEMSTVEVDHSAWCHGLIFRHQDGWSFAYSGDTVPCDRLARAADGVSLLIHEATMADDQLDEAKAKKHSTVSQAMEIAERANAKRVLLTHFSARYPKLPKLRASSMSSNWAIAFDGLSIRLGDIWKMKYYLKAIEQTYLDGDNPEEELDTLDL